MLGEINCDALAQSQTDNIVSDGSAVVIGWDTHKRDRRCDEVHLGADLVNYEAPAMGAAWQTRLGPCAV